MNRLEPTPSEAMHASTAPLNLDTDQRLNLVHELRTLSSELQENPFVTPERTTSELRGVRLRPLQKNAPASYLGLSITHLLGEPAAAHISLTSARLSEQEQRTYIHRPSFNVWEDWRPGASEPVGILSNESLVASLEPQLPHGTLDSLMDISLEDTDVAQILADTLQKKARTRIDQHNYKAHDVEAGGREYTRDTDFIIATNNTRTSYNLFVAASLMLDDFGHVRKTYHYEAVDINGSLKSASGSLCVAASSRVPTPRRNAFAHCDQVRNDPAQGIVTGTRDIRDTYTSLYSR